VNFPFLWGAPGESDQPNFSPPFEDQKTSLPRIGQHFPEPLVMLGSGNFFTGKA
jgi:hypothetical protein